MATASRRANSTSGTANATSQPKAGSSRRMRGDNPGAFAQTDEIDMPAASEKTHPLSVLEKLRRVEFLRIELDESATQIKYLYVLRIQGT